MLEIRTYMSEPERGPQSWTNQDAERDAVYANRRRIRATVASGCSADAANCSNDRLRISTRRVGCGERTCADTRMC
jgi:hypothetical protein